MFLGLGSNLGDRAENIREAVDRLGALPGVRVVRVSSLYETAPVGLTDQPDFINAAVEVETDLPPCRLLDAILEIERSMGRVRDVRWGPRVVDIDILIYDEVECATPELTLPHPRMMERAFVMAPLAEIAPELVLPDGRKPAEVLAELGEVS
ncbi:MAG: 2-amino-4-hydroxy-6-hydroxymethyldihydropteridine diphosphokinase [Armatimonadota bacterium]